MYDKKDKIKIYCPDLYFWYLNFKVFAFIFKENM